MWHNMDVFGMMGFGGWGMGFFWLVILALIVWAIVAFTRSNRSRNEPRLDAPRRSSGLDILEERYARGELDREEYLQKKKDIIS